MEALQSPLWHQHISAFYSCCKHVYVYLCVRPVSFLVSDACGCSHVMYLWCMCVCHSCDIHIHMIYMYIRFTVEPLINEHLRDKEFCLLQGACYWGCLM